MNNNQFKETIIGIGEAAGCTLEFTLVHIAITTFPPMIFIPIAAFWIQAFASFVAMLWVRIRYSSTLEIIKNKREENRKQKPLVLRILAMVVFPLLAYAASFAFAVWEESTLKIGVFKIPENLSFSPDNITRIFSQYFTCGMPCAVNLLILSPICEEIVFRYLIPQVIAIHQGEYANSSTGMKTQAIWSSLFFGVYHIVQLVYSAGENPLLTLFQIVDAAAIGWYFFWVDHDIFSGSIVPSILLHILNNAFSAFVTPNYEMVKTLYGVFFFGTALVIEILGYTILVSLFASSNKEEKKQKKTINKKKRN